MKVKSLVLSVLAVAICGVVNAQSAISWEISTQLFNAADQQSFVDTIGDSVLAVNADPNVRSSVLSGVAFEGQDLFSLESGFTNNGVTLSFAAGASENETAFGVGSLTDTDVNGVLASAAFEVEEITFSGLTVGETYRIQIVSNDARNDRNTNFETIFSNGQDDIATSVAGNTAGFNTLSFRDPVDLTGEGSGGSLIGVFNAVSTSQSIFVAGSTNGGTVLDPQQSIINGLQLRVVTVPEPSSIVVLGLASLIFVRRRKA